MKGLLRGLYERSIYERTFLSERIENHAISNALSKVKRVKKHLNKHYCVLRHDGEPSRIPIRILERLFCNCITIVVYIMIIEAALCETLKNLHNRIEI